MQLKYLWSEIDQLSDLVSKTYAYIMTCYCKSYYSYLSDV